MTYREQLKALSDELLALQKPILVLDAIKWPYQYKVDFLNHRGTRLPPVDAAFYEKQKLNFDAASTQAALRDLQQRIRTSLGPSDPLGLMLQQNLMLLLLCAALLFAELRNSVLRQYLLMLLTRIVLQSEMLLPKILKLRR